MTISDCRSIFVCQRSTVYNIYLRYLTVLSSKSCSACVSIGYMNKNRNVVFSSLPGNSSMFIRHFVEPGFLLLPHLDVVFCKEFLQPAQLIKEQNFFQYYLELVK
jgi:hypothetical protein